MDDLSSFSEKIYFHILHILHVRSSRYTAPLSIKYAYWTSQLCWVTCLNKSPISAFRAFTAFSSLILIFHSFSVQFLELATVVDIVL